MKTYNLPDDFIKDQAYSNDEVIIRYNQADHNSRNNKIILNRNMINLLISGRKTIVYPETTVTISDAELVVLTTGNILTSEVSSEDREFTSILVYFSNEILNRFWVKYESQMSILQVQHVQQPYLTFTQDAFIRQYIGSLQLLLHGPVELSKEIKQIKFEELFLYLFQLDKARLLSLKIVSKDEGDLRLRKIVESHIGHPVTVEELAFLCNMSSSTFKRNFQRIYNTSPQQYLLVQKLQQAATLLKSPSESPSAVYLKIGYKNHSSFSKAFRLQYGLNPSEYHAQYLNVQR